MRPHAPRDVEHSGERVLLVGVGRRLAAARQQVPAGPLGGHEQGRLRVDPRGGAGDLDPAPDLGRVGEVGHPVRAHAAGVGERRGELARRARSRAAPCGGGGGGPELRNLAPRRAAARRREQRQTRKRDRVQAAQTQPPSPTSLRSASSSSSMVCGRVRPRANRVRRRRRKSPSRTAAVDDTVLVHAVSDRPGPLVLVVEDEPEIAALMRDFLEADGFRVLHAADAEQAAEALRLGAGLRAARRDAPGRVGLRPLPRDPRRLGRAGPLPERARRRRRQDPRPRPRRRRLHRQDGHPGRGRRPRQGRPPPLRRGPRPGAAPLRPARGRPRRTRGAPSPAGRCG